MSLRRFVLLSAVVLLAVVLSATLSLAAPPADKPVTPQPGPFSDRYPAEVDLASRADLDTLLRLDIDVANVRPADETVLFPGPDDPFVPLVATVYVNEREASALAAEGLVARPIVIEQPSGWPTYDQFVARMQALATNYPDLVRLVSLGQSVQGRELWALKLTDNPDVAEDEPEVRYLSTMHGIEPVGTELTLRLAELLAASYGVDPDLTTMVDEMEIWLMPLVNPDGYVNNTYVNANGVNLNRDFPDRITDPVNDPAGREPETQAIMNWTYGRHFVMGANYHTGALVVNYPWDSVPATPDYAPDDALYYDYSVGYAVRNPMIWTGGFPNGVTRGWEWYIIRGGLQDWAYHWQGEHHVTIELSNQQPPPYSQMDTYWDNNREAMLWWMRRALAGARGLVTDAYTGAPLDATVDVVQIGKPVRTDPDIGDYHRLLLPGTYTVMCSAEGYLDQAWPVQVVSGTATVQDCALLPEASFGVAAGDSELAGAPGETVTHTFTITNTGTLSDTYLLALTSGDWPATLLDAQVGPLNPLESGQARVTVEIPNLLPGESLLATDLLTLTVTSAADPQVSAQAQGTTHAVADLALALAVADPRREALAGQAVTYTLAVTNTGGYTDACALLLAGDDWSTSVTPSQTQPLAPGQAAVALVRVEIPATPANPTDTVTVRAVSGWDAGLYAEQELRTRAVTGLAAELDASPDHLSALGGRVVTYSLSLQNTGDYTDTYTLSLDGADWPSQLVPLYTGPLPPGISAMAGLVRIGIPEGLPGEMDVITVTATSIWDAGIQSAQRLTTTRRWGVYLPLVVRK